MTTWELAAVWVGSVGTVLAFLIALVVFVISVADRQRAQARLVLGYISEGWISYPAGTRVASMRGGAKAPREFPAGVLPSTNLEGAVVSQEVQTIQWTLTNNSDEMIGPTRLALVDESGREIVESTARRFVLPGTSESLYRVFPSQGAPTGHLRAEVKFRDAVGRTWMRLEGERLRRMWRPIRKKIDIPDRPSGIWKPAGIPGSPQTRVFVADKE